MRTRALAIAALWVGGLVTVTYGQYAAPRPTAAPTFNKDVAPILYKNCTNCHRRGEIAPMSLLTYEEARPWAKSIRREVSNGTMPPWHADPAHGEFLNDRRLSEADKTTILKWVDGGASKGDPADVPPPPKYAEGWMIGEPDVVLRMREDYPIPAEGTIAYQYFEVPTNFAEDKWVQAVEVRPGHRELVHHVIVYAREPQPEKRVAVFKRAEGMEVPAGQTGGPKLPEDKRKPVGPNDRPAPKVLGASIGAYVPGQATFIYPAGTAVRVAADSVLTLQMHYTANGAPTTDRTEVGIIFAKEPPKTEIRITNLSNGSLKIPAGVANHRVDAEMTLLRDVTLWSILPHTHIRGKRWEYEVIYPDGRIETILSVPKYDFNWQTDYVFKQPLKLQAGTKLHAIAWYDNSPNNPSNPDPSADVWWGDQTWEEMMFTGLSYSVDGDRRTDTASAPAKRNPDR